MRVLQWLIIMGIQHSEVAIPQQTDGAAMGSPVSLVVANLYMEMFEEMALSTAQPKPRVWRRLCG